MDRHPSKMMSREMNLLKEFYQISDYVEFRLPRPSNQPTRPPSGYMVIYKDYFLKELRLPLHPFFKEALLNLDVSLPQLNPNAVESLVALWVLYRINRFPDLTLEKFQAHYTMKNSPITKAPITPRVFLGRPSLVRMTTIRPRKTMGLKLLLKC